MLRSVKRGPMRDNSRNIAVHMTEEQYQRLQRYMKMTRTGSTVYFRKLIKGDRMIAHVPELDRSMHSGVNRIHSNVQQIAQNLYACEWAVETVTELEFLSNKLCEEVFHLSCQS